MAQHLQMLIAVPGESQDTAGETCPGCNYYSSEDTHFSASQLGNLGLAPMALLFPEKLMLFGHGRTSTQHPGFFVSVLRLTFIYFCVYVSVCVLVSAAAWMS